MIILHICIFSYRNIIGTKYVTSNVCLYLAKIVSADFDQNDEPSIKSARFSSKLWRGGILPGCPSQNPAYCSHFKVCLNLPSLKLRFINTNSAKHHRGRSHSYHSSCPPKRLLTALQQQMLADSIPTSLAMS